MPKGRKTFNRGAKFNTMSSPCGRVFAGNPKNIMAQAELHEKTCPICMTSESKLEDASQHKSKAEYGMTKLQLADLHAKCIAPSHPELIGEGVRIGK